MIFVSFCARTVVCASYWRLLWVVVVVLLHPQFLIMWEVVRTELRSPYSGAVRWSRLSLFIIAIPPPLPPLLLLLPPSAAFSSFSSLLFLSTVSSSSCDYWHLVHGCSSPVLSAKDILYYSSPTAELLYDNPTFACCRRRFPLLPYSLVSSTSPLS